MNRPPMEGVNDHHGRRASYVRISVTDRCNLRCRYCMPETVEFTPHDQILRYEEIERLVGVSAELGITKVRLTGGEPLVRKDFGEFLKRLHSSYPELDLRLTTNGTLLRANLPHLLAAGVGCVNISLDTLDPERFHRITGVDSHAEVLAGIEQALEMGIRIKLNVVGLKGVNDDELGGFIDLARQKPVDIRFIEFMPIGGCVPWRPESIWPAEEIIQEAKHLATLVPVVDGADSSGPVRLFNVADGLGRVGVISPMSSHFCGTCNRLRITSTGKLRTCLYSDREYRLRPILSHPRLGDEAVKRVIGLAGLSKPLGYEILSNRKERAVCSTRMSAIGG